MKPSKIPAGQQLLIRFAYGEKRMAYFMERDADKGVCRIRFPAFAGMYGPDDAGICEMSDHELSQRGEFLQ